MDAVNRIGTLLLSAYHKTNRLVDFIIKNIRCKERIKNFIVLLKRYAYSI